ncbi:MAG: DUF58 domain-containing protein [Pirellulaceae bacterium]|nr:DUF58 domain-containing protein [Pirellulaceae bacterium]
MNWERSAVYRYLRYLWTYRFTAGGKWVIAGLLLSAALGSASVEITIYQIFCALFALLCVDRFAGFLLRPALEVRGAFPARATAGQVVTGRYELVNRGKRTAYDLGLRFFRLPHSFDAADPETTLGHLPPGRHLSAAIRLRPQRRGLYALPPPRAYSTFPFNLTRDGRSRAEAPKLLVLPHFHPLAGLDVPIGTRYQPGGIALTSNVGESPEYIGNREYVPGDSARRIDHRSWARLARPVVREYQEEYYCRVALVLDTFVPPQRRAGREGFADLEAAISVSAAVADTLSRGEYLIDLFAAGPELYVFRAGRHTAHFENILEIVACVEACRRNPFETLAPALADELTNISTVIGVFLDWDASRRHLARTAVESGCSVKLLIVRDGQTSEPIDFDEGQVIPLSIAQIRQGGIEVL